MARIAGVRASSVLAALLVPAPLCAADLQPKTLRAWDAYVARAEQRITRELDSSTPSLVVEQLPPTERTRAERDLAASRVFMIKLRSPELRARDPDPPDGLIHHWLGVARIPQARLDDVLRFVQRYDEHAQFFDDVVASRLIARDGDDFQVFLKLRRKKIVTVTYNTTHEVRYRRHDPRHASSRSVATKVAELDQAGSPSEREKPPGHDSGYLWRLNSYWRFVEDDGGVAIECESLSLSRDIPFGLGWLVRPMVEDISRESLERTLASISRGVRGSGPPTGGVH